MSRPVVFACDGCGVESRTDDYGLPTGWVRVKAMQPRQDRAEAEGDFCSVCACNVNTVELAGRGRPWNTGTPKRKGKAKPTTGEELTLEEEDDMATDVAEEPPHRGE